MTHPSWADSTITKYMHQEAKPVWQCSHSNFQGLSTTSTAACTYQASQAELATHLVLNRRSIKWQASMKFILRQWDLALAKSRMSLQYMSVRCACLRLWRMKVTTASAAASLTGATPPAMYFRAMGRKFSLICKPHEAHCGLLA